MSEGKGNTPPAVPPLPMEPPPVPPPPPQHSNSTKLALRLMMSGSEVGSVIGRGGHIIGGIRKKSGCRIHITDGSVPERIITVTGSTTEIIEAFGMILTRLEQVDDEKERKNCKSDLSIKLVVAVSRCGALIGKNGCKIQEICERSHAYMRVSRDLLPNSTERLVTITGRRSEVINCVSQVCCVLLETPPQSSLVLFKPERKRKESSSSRIREFDARSSMAIGDTEERRGGSGFQSDSKMLIPNDVIGRVIGRGGAKIADIRRMSGADIQISDMGSGSNTSEVNIYGSDKSITLARLLIEVSAENENEQSRSDRREEKSYKRTGDNREDQRTYSKKLKYNSS